MLKSAHAVDREFEWALHKSSVPVPEMIIYCDDPSVIGVKFFIMSEVAGETIFEPVLNNYEFIDRTKLFGQKSTPCGTSEHKSVGDQFRKFWKPYGYIERQLSIWTNQYCASETVMVHEMEFLIKELPKVFKEPLSGFVLFTAIFASITCLSK